MPEKRLLSGDVLQPSIAERSILRPKSLIIFVNRFLTEVYSKITLHAKGVKFCKEIGTMLDSQALQVNLDRLYQCSVANGFLFSAFKCKVMQITCRQDN